MKPSKPPKNLRLSPVRITVTSLILAIITFCLLWFIKSRYIVQEHPEQIGAPSRPTLDDFSNLLSVLIVVIGLMLPTFFVLFWRLLNWFKPRPGGNAFSDEQLAGLKKAMAVDRGEISFAMVPAHQAKASPAKNSRKIDLGDASLVIPSEHQQRIIEFVGRPRSFKNNSQLEYELESDIMVITGEPGAGKSVLLQELHATLSLGVEEGFHSFVPLIVFARDLTQSTLETASNDSDAPMRTFLMAYYENRLKATPMSEDLKYLFNLIAHRWNEGDFLVFFDGLDEIAQRSSYELIQRNLAKIILQDLKLNRKSIHRYILSCRIDEDLELFHGSQNLFIPGLGEKKREEFCQALIGETYLDGTTRRQLQEALNSLRLTPSHVFRRNPYFLALLLSHIREDQERVRDQRIDFDILMRKYLERESIRPYASPKNQEYLRVEDRRVLFGELEKISRACLQYIAFRSASSARVGALYDEVYVDENLVLGFLDIINSASATSGNHDPWNTLFRFIVHLLNPDRSKNLSSEEVQRLGFTKHLHENDVRLFNTLANKLVEGQVDYQELLIEALGTIPYRGIQETEEWYQQFVIGLLTCLEFANLELAHKLVALLFIRSTAAAHLLRILIVIISPKGIALRFRHRRLAEYYAACYLRDRWADVSSSLDFTPWLNPVLNLTCALEGPECKVLRRLINRIEDTPKEPFFEWRHNMEAAVEAAFFAEPGKEYDLAIYKLLQLNIDAINSLGSAGLASNSSSNTQTDSSKSALSDVITLDPVTEISILRAIVQLARLRRNIRSKSLIDRQSIEHFYEYERNAPPHWIAPALQARIAIQSVSLAPQNLWNKWINFWKLAKQPNVVFLRELSVFPSGSLFLKVSVFLTTILSEIILITLASSLFIFPFYGLTKALKIESGVGIHTTQAFGAIILFSLIVQRLLSWQQSPTSAATRGALLWRGISLFFRIARSLLTGKPRIDWRNVLQKIFTFPKILGSVIVTCCIVLAVIYVSPFVAKKGELTPCPEIGEIQGSIWKKYTSSRKIIDEKSIQDLQLEVRADLEGLRDANPKRCGFESEQGWILADERLADRLVEFDPKLAPLPPPDLFLTLDADECRALQMLPSIPLPPDPERGVIGRGVSIYEYIKYEQILSELESIHLRIVNARRKGRGVQSSSISCDISMLSKDAELARRNGEEIKAANILLKSMDTLLKGRREKLIPLKVHASESTLYYVFGGVVLIMLIILVRAGSSRRSDKKQINKLQQVDSFSSLCQAVLNPKFNERVKLFVLKRLDAIGIRSEKELQLIEETAQTLLNQPYEADKGIGIAMANLARTLSNRLRHRISTDVPRQKAPHP